MEIAIMIEGQDGLNWERWQRLAYIVEELGFVGLYRSDHFTNPHPPDLDSLELWVSLTWLASHTQSLEFGPMVAPLSFRHPVWLARTAIAIDDLSGERLTLGLGAGWQEREHHAFGFDLLAIEERFSRFREGLDVITRLLRSTESVTYQGTYYQLHDAQLLPRSKRQIPILIGGNGKNRTLPLVAEYADEWNGVFISASRYAELNQLLNILLEKWNRPLSGVKRSLMTGILFGETDAKVQEKLKGRSADELRQKHGFIVGTPSATVDQLGELEAVGVQRVMLNWFDLDDIDGLEKLAAAVMD